MEKSLEIHHPPHLKLIVCAACLLGGFLTFFVCLAYLPSPTRYIGLVSLFINSIAARFFWRYFGSFVIHADSEGIRRTTMLHTQSVRWNQIDTMQMQRIGGDGAIVTLALEDEDGNTLLGFRRGFATRDDQEKLLAFIRARMGELEGR